MSAPPDQPKSSLFQPVAEITGSLAALPRVGFVRRQAASRAESAETGVVFGINSLAALMDVAKQHFGVGVPPEVPRAPVKPPSEPA